MFLGEKKNGEPCPIMSAHYLCDQHVVKLAVEEGQMTVSACLNNGAPAGYMPETKGGTIHRGGYRNHPMTRWTGESKANFDWAMAHWESICDQYRLRYGKDHFAQKQLEWIRDAVFHEKGRQRKLRDYIPDGPLTPFPRCVNQSQGRNLDLLDESKYTTVDAYRIFYIREKRGFAKWAKGVTAPSWWPLEE